MRNLIILLFLTGSLLFAQETKAPEIKVTPEFFDFGKIVEGTTVHKEFEIANIGNDTLKIERVRASCGCTAAKPDKNLLLPGESTTVEVSFNSTRRFGQQRKHVYIFSNDPKNSEFRFSFGAVVVAEKKDEAELHDAPQLKIDRYSYDFGKVKEGAKLNFTFALKNFGKELLEIRDVKTSCGCTVANLSSKKLRPGEEGRMSVELDTSDRSGKIAKTVTLYSNDPKNPEQTITLFVNILERNS